MYRILFLISGLRVIIEGFVRVSDTKKVVLSSNKLLYGPGKWCCLLINFYMDQVSAISTHLLSSNKLLYGPGKCYIYTSTIF